MRTHTDLSVFQFEHKAKNNNKTKETSPRKQSTVRFYWRNIYRRNGGNSVANLTAFVIC